MIDTTTLEGRCACGAVRYGVTGAPLWVAHCHCNDCRRATGAALATYAGYRSDRFTLTAGTPRVYHSSPGVARRFCGDCGTPLTYRSAARPTEIDVTICSLEQPERAAPVDHIWMQDAPPWDRPNDGLPQYAAGRAPP